MNIIIGETTHTLLQEYILDTIEFGSAMKGQQTDQSDHDYLHIIKPSIHWFTAPVNTHHLLQYRSPEGNDHIYCTPQTFVKSLVDGDSTIFHEMWRYGALQNTCLQWLHGVDFNHYKTMRAYLGLARRDVKEVTKLWMKDQRKALKKFNFSFDAYTYVRDLMGKENSIRLGIHPDMDIQNIITQCKAFNELIDELRTELNQMLDQGKVHHTLSATCLDMITNLLDPSLYDLQDYDIGLEYFFESHANGN